MITHNFQVPDGENFDVVVARSERDAAKRWMDNQIKQANICGYSDEKWLRRHGHQSYQYMLSTLTKKVQRFPGRVLA